MRSDFDIITVLGHTAAGKTKLAAHLAYELDGEVISADSRQVYKGMNIGTGKDYNDYLVEGKKIPYHLIDCVEAGEEYNVYEYQKDCYSVIELLKNREKLPVLCGGSGLYLEAVLRKYTLERVPVNMPLREKLDPLDLGELEKILRSLGPLHNISDIENKERAVRAIEIATFMKKAAPFDMASTDVRSVTVGIRFSRDERRQRITMRLKERMDNGMIEEARTLLKAGVSHERLEYYGLEYKYLSFFLKGAISYEEMIDRLNTAIHQFAKRQMTYFRGMERRGILIHWLEGPTTLKQKVEQVKSLLLT